MQPGAEPAPFPASQSFAGFLAALAIPAAKPASEWPKDGLEDDVATLSYERALRTHARSRATYPNDGSLTQPTAQQPTDYETFQTETLDPGQKARRDPGTGPAACVESAQRLPELPERSLRSASITIRMSQAECAQLHQRAAEAGMTISAYLRSCTFEAESLRAMVKDTLAQLRSATGAGKGAPMPHRSRMRWLGRVLTPWQGSQRTAQS